MWEVICYKFIDLKTPHQIVDKFVVPELETARTIANNYELINDNTICEIEPHTV